MFGDEAEREAFFEQARAQAEKEFEQDNTNAQALVRWGGALLELAHYKQGDEAKLCIAEAIMKLNKAIQIDPERTDAEWCLGNAYTSLGFLAGDKEEAMEHFNMAETVFKRCKEKEPSNETYKKALEMCKKAPDYYDEIQAQIAGMSAPGSSGASGGGKKQAAEGNEFWWDLAGWVTLGALIFGALAFAKSAGPPPKA